MKPIYYRKYTPTNEESFLVRYAEVPHTYNRFHYHEEYEILYNIQNSGTRFIGDSILRFDNGDLVMVGPHIPHYWHSDDFYYDNKSKVMAKVILIQFSENFLGEHFWDLPEINKIKNLLNNAAHGICFTERSAKKIGAKIIHLSKASGWKKLMLMIEILCLMSDTKDYKLLSNISYTKPSKQNNQNKISDIFHYIVSNYNKNITLNDVAEFANMNKSAFCRYFKRSTSKTFSQILNEIRIGFACKKLIDSEIFISEIAYQCGYYDAAYFNRVFKKIKGISPQNYRKTHLNTKSKS